MVQVTLAFEVVVLIHLHLHPLLGNEQHYYYLFIGTLSLPQILVTSICRIAINATTITTTTAVITVFSASAFLLIIILKTAFEMLVVIITKVTAIQGLILVL